MITPPCLCSSHPDNSVRNCPWSAWSDQLSNGELMWLAQDPTVIGGSWAVTSEPGATAATCPFLKAAIISASGNTRTDRSSLLYWGNIPWIHLKDHATERVVSWGAGTLRHRRRGENSQRCWSRGFLSGTPILLPQFTHELICLRTLDSSTGKAEMQSVLAGLLLNSAATNTRHPKDRIIIDRGENQPFKCELSDN